MKIDKNTTIIDVRSPEEFSGQHVPGAINIPLDQLAARVAEIKALSQPIVVYCRSGVRSGMAVSILKQNGIDNVTNGGGLGDMLIAIK